MESSSITIVLLELIISVCGGFFCIQRLVLSGGRTDLSSLNVLFLTIISPFWLLWSESAGRFLSFKVSLFVCSAYFAFRFPRKAVLLIASILLMEFLPNISTTMFSSKYNIFPITMFLCCIFLYQDRMHINITPLFFASFLDMLWAYSVGLRSGFISVLIVMCLISSRRLSILFIDLAKWMPFMYLLAMLIVFYFLQFDSTFIPFTSSNLERSSMIGIAIINFFNYLFTGPRINFDEPVNIIMKSFGFTLYENPKGVDPHSFLLSLWRDEGAILTVLWVFVWFNYWKRITIIKPFLNEIKSRICIALLSVAVIQFSLLTPSASTRLILALIFGSILGFAVNWNEGSNELLYADKS